MRIFTDALGAALLIVSLAAAPIVAGTLAHRRLPAGGAAKVEAWRIEQISDYYGHQTLQWTDTALCLLMERAHLVAISKAPDWSVNLYNTQSHQVFKIPFEQFVNRFGDLPLPDETRILVRANKTELIAGQKTIKWCMIVRDPRRRETLITQIWTAADVTVPAHAALGIERMCRLPRSIGLPLRVVRTGAAPHVMALETTAIEKVQVAPEIFTIPADAHPVGSEVSLMLEEDEATGAAFCDLTDLAKREQQSSSGATMPGVARPGSSSGDAMRRPARLP